MSAEDFVRIVREGNEKLRVDDVVVNAGSVKLRGRGILQVEQEKPLRIDLTLSGRNAPPSHSRVTTKKDFWSLSGIINGHLRFQCDNVSPGGNWRSANGIVTITRTLPSIELVTERFDSPNRIKRVKASAKRMGLKPFDDPNEYSPDRSFSFEATLVNCDLPATNAWSETKWTNDFLRERLTTSADTFIGEMATTRYAFIREENKRDLDIYLRSKDECQSVSEEDDLRKFRALLNAFAFADGVQPWPFHIRYERGGHCLSERISAARTPPKTNFSPFSRPTGREYCEDFARAIRLIAEFLEPKTSLNSQLTHLLFLFREAGKNTVQLEIRILALCALLEGLVRTIYKELSLGKPRASNRKKKPPAAQNIFKAVAQKLRIPWQDEMEPLFAEWERARNPSAHGDFPPEVEPGADEQQALEQMFFGLSRIAGGFNMILLKLFGYTGIYRASTFEDVYRKL
jgi:hypothetical protein